MENMFKSSRRQYFNDADVDVTITVENDIGRGKLHLIEEAVDELFDKVQKITSGSSHKENMKITDSPLGMQIEFS